MSQMLKLSAPISELRPVVAALRFDSFRSAMHDIHDITDREPCERLAMHLHILRILQEVFTNIVKHAHATNIHVETGLDAAGEHVYIQVRDNGTGFSSECMGRGISSMRHRAKIIGGHLDIRPSAAGTTLNLLLPVS